MTINVGLVGFGSSGSVIHAPLILASNMRIVAVVTRRQAEVKALIPTARVYATLEECLQVAEIDLVVIATPNHLHVTQAMAALNAGKHVVVDKPCALNALDARKLENLAVDRNRKLSVFHNRRWDSDILTIQKLLAAKSLGDVHSFQARWDRYRPQVPDRWRERAEFGGGLLLDLGPHLIDQVVHLFGQPDWVEAKIERQRTAATVNDAFELRMGKGSLDISLSAGCLTVDHAERYRILGSNAAFVKSGLDVQEDQLKQSMHPQSASFGVEPISQWGSLINSEQSIRPVPAEVGCWTAFYRCMKKAIANDAPVPVSMNDVITGLTVIEAAEQSSREGRRIELPAIEIGA